MIIVFSGLDGTGKTTQATHLVRDIKSKGADCVYRHAIKGTLYYFIVHKVIGRLSSGVKSGLEKGLRQKTKKKSFSLLSMIKKVFLIIDVVYFKARYGRLKGNNNKHIVCDRYFYDEMVQARYLSFSGKVFSVVYEKLIPLPDLLFFSRVDPETAFRRKEGEGYDMSYFEIKAKLYDEFMGQKEAVTPLSGGEEEVKQIVLLAWNNAK